MGSVRTWKNFVVFLERKGREESFVVGRFSFSVRRGALFVCVVFFFR